MGKRLRSDNLGWKDRQLARMSRKKWKPENRHLKIVLIGGARGKRTAATILSHILQTQGEVVSISDDTIYTVDELYEELYIASKLKSSFVVLRIGEPLFNSKVLQKLRADILIVPSCVTTEQASRLFKVAQPIKFVYGLISGEDPLVDNEDIMVSFSVDGRTDAVITDIKQYRKGTEFKLVIDHQVKLSLATHLIGRFNCFNIASAVAGVYALHLPLTDIDESVADIEEVSCNYQYLDVENVYSVAIDMADDFSTISSIISDIAKLVKRRLIVVVDASKVGEKNIEQLSTQAQRLILLDVNDFKRDKTDIERVVSPEGAYRKIIQIARQGDTVLLFGHAFAQRDETGNLTAVTGLSKV